MASAILSLLFFVFFFFYTLQKCTVKYLDFYDVLNVVIANHGDLNQKFRVCKLFEWFERSVLYSQGCMFLN